MKTRRKNLQALAALFRGPFLRRVAEGVHLSTFAELLDYASDDRVPPCGAPLHVFFDYFYDRLVEEYRCEYVFKNAIATSFSGKAGPTVLAGELAVGGSRVDLAVINGTSTAFEIKTELDTASRLEGQLRDYRNVFDRVFVIVPPKLTARYESITPPDIGLMTLDAGGGLDMVRESASHKAEVVPAIIFDCLRRAEYTAIIGTHFGSVPKVPSGLLYRECKRLFCQLLPFEAHSYMVSELGKRQLSKAKAALVVDIPNSLKFAAITLAASQTEFKALLNALNSPFHLYEDLLPVFPRKAERVACPP